MKRSNVIGVTIKIFVFNLFLICSIDASLAASTKVIGFGDSITAGWPYVKSDQNASTAGGYEPTLRTLLIDAGWDVSVLNYGHQGELSFEGDDRIQSVLSTQKPDWVLVLEGTNDLYWISTDSVMSHLASMVNKVRADGSNVVLATLTPDTRGGKPISQMNDTIRAWASENEVPLADQYAAVAPYWNTLYSIDMLHPNIAGYRVMARTWFDAIIANSGSGFDIAPVLLLLLTD